uniref:Mitochondrial ribosomal protein S30 n=1 Tax=Jaculus jaculus TaxID=51337 RepID=A0A8C5NVL1_JACJA
MAAARYWRLAVRGGGPSTRAAASVTPAAAAETAVARYPPIVASMTADSKAARLRRVQRWQASAHAAPSVDAKLRILTKMQFQKYVVYPQTPALHADRWYQAFTKTAFVPGWPAPAAAAPTALDVASTSNQFYLNDEGKFCCLFIDYMRPVHFYWLRGEEVIQAGHRKGRIDALRYQINDRPHSQLRIPKQLPEFVPLDCSVPEEIPVMKCKPDKVPLFKRQYENTIFTGSKTADPCCYGHTQFHVLPHKLQREKLLQRNCAEQIEVVNRANAIASLFAWTGAQAMYQGFWSEADVTRPFVSQAVITDGKYFSFFCYQLNTLALTVQADQNNPRKNLCWGTESKPLYEAVEDDGVKGFNDEVLLQIVHFLLNKPKEEQPPLREIPQGM